MACMTHTCSDCNHMVFNNGGLGSCPKCGSDDIIHHYDEDNEPYGYDDEDEDE